MTSTLSVAAGNLADDTLTSEEQRESDALLVKQCSGESMPPMPRPIVNVMRSSEFMYMASAHPTLADGVPRATVSLMMFMWQDGHIVTTMPRRSRKYRSFRSNHRDVACLFHNAAPPREGTQPPQETAALMVYGRARELTGSNATAARAQHLARNPAYARWITDGVDDDDDENGIATIIVVPWVARLCDMHDKVVSWEVLFNKATRRPHSKWSVCSRYALNFPTAAGHEMESDFVASPTTESRVDDLISPYRLVPSISLQQPVSSPTTLPSTTEPPSSPSRPSPAASSGSDNDAPLLSAKASLPSMATVLGDAGCDEATDDTTTPHWQLPARRQMQLHKQWLLSQESASASASSSSSSSTTRHPHSPKSSVLPMTVVQRPDDSPMQPTLPDAVKVALASTQFGYLATLTSGRPHLSMMNFTYHDECIIMTTSSKTAKFRSMLAYSHVVLLLHTSVSPDASSSSSSEIPRTQSVTVTGTVSMVDGEDSKRLRAVHLGKNPDYGSFIVGDDIVVLCVRIERCHVCDDRNNVSCWQSDGTTFVYSDEGSVDGSEPSPRDTAVAAASSTLLATAAANVPSS